MAPSTLSALRCRCPAGTRWTLAQASLADASLSDRSCVTSPTVGQVHERIRADDDNLNALQQLARSQDGAVSDVVPEALSRYLAAFCESPSQ
jgi:hypothetical protein